MAGHVTGDRRHEPGHDRRCGGGDGRLPELLGLQESLVGRDPLHGAIHFGPSIDGELVKGPLVGRVRAGHAQGIDLLIGSNRDEIRFFAQFDPDVLRMTQRDYDAWFPRQLAGRRAELVRAYEEQRPGESESDITPAMLTDQVMRVPATRLAEAQGRWARTYVYQFDWAPEGGLGAVHTAELPFVFGTLSFTGIPGGAEAFRADPAPIRHLARLMGRSWTSFARDGHPGWPRYRWGRATRSWDTPPTLAFAPRERERAAWAGFDFPALELGG
ncbi:carboxylesterase family protein [Actinosynnema sp. CS-041913]|uniref:carboxylesterase family protein n=1 Tax=Actinosynnema sp. CS-041913 TaxID=3239917 RepID=UPI003D8F866A